MQMLVPTAPLRSHMIVGPGFAVPRLTAFYEWLVVGGRRYYSAAKVSNEQNATVAIRDGALYTVGQLKHIVAVQLGLPQLGVATLAAVHLAKPVHISLPDDSHWHTRSVIAFIYTWRSILTDV
jgi:hypothetical protein